MRPGNPRRRGRLRHVAAIMLAVSGMSGCAHDAGADGAPPLDLSMPGIDESGNAPSLARSLLVGSETGLRIRQWRVGDDPARIADVLARYRDGVVLGDAVRTQFERNGFRLTRVRLTDLDAILAELGPTTAVADGWHGQMYSWRSLASRPVGAAGRAVRIDDAERRLAGGRLRLMMRGWTTPMESGPLLYLELMPEFDQSRRSRVTQMLGTRSFIGERFEHVAAYAFLEDGFGYILAATSTATEPGVTGTTITTPTIGELLLRSDAFPPRRHVLVFIPKIPASFFPEPRRMAVGPTDGSDDRSVSEEPAP